MSAIDWLNACSQLGLDVHLGEDDELRVRAIGRMPEQLGNALARAALTRLGRRRTEVRELLRNEREAAIELLIRDAAPRELGPVVRRRDGHPVDKARE